MLVTVSDDALKTFVVCAAWLVLKFVVTVQIQSSKSRAAGSKPPEDSAMSLHSKPAPQEVSLLHGDEPNAAAVAEEKRWLRIVGNDLESLPIALFVFTLALLAGCNETVLIATVIVYTVFRTTYTIAYAKGLQPYRSMSYGLGLLSVLVALGATVFATFKHKTILN